MKHQLALSAFLLLAGAGAALPQDGLKLIKTMVFVEGKCDFKVDAKALGCAHTLTYATFRNGRVQIGVLPDVLVAVSFSGGRDQQPDPEHYYLTVDRLFLSGGTEVKADGLCSIRLRADGQRVYHAGCKVLARDGRVFSFEFAGNDKPPTIKSFQ